jgi:hypothetical protein
MLDSRYNVTRHSKLMFVRLVYAVLAFAMIIACDPQSGSETHWDPICSSNQDCAAPLECICGDCFLPCEGQSDCAGQAPATECSSQQVLVDNCYFVPDGISGACFPPCTSDSDCAGFGEGKLCNDGVCIRPQ